MNKTITPRQDNFCVNYTTIGADTYSNGTKSALAAGYAETSAHVSATKLLKQEAIRNRINEIQAENARECDYSIEQWRKDVLQARDIAIKQNSPMAMARTLELLGKHIGAFEKDNAQQGPTFMELIALMAAKRSRQIESSPIDVFCATSGALELPDADNGGNGAGQGQD